MRAFYLVRMGQDEAEAIYLEQGRETVPALEERRLVPVSLLWNWLSEWETLYRQSEQQKQIFPQDPAVDREIEARMRQMGISLFALLFAHALDGLPETPAGEDKPYLSLIADAEFAAIPFEISFHQRFLYQALHVVRQVRGRSNDSLHRAQESRQFLMILNPNGAEDIAHYVSRESEALRRLFPGNSSLPLKVIHSRNIRKGLLLQEMAAARYIHFAGHSEPDGIPLADSQKLGKEEIRYLNLERTELVFFNSCFSAGQNRDNSSLVQAFAAAGVQSFIGYSRQIREDIALEAALLVWRHALARPHTQERVLADEVREHIRLNYGKGCPAWTILAQYGALPQQESKPLPGDKGGFRAGKPTQSSTDKRKFTAAALALVALAIGVAGWWRPDFLAPIFRQTPLATFQDQTTKETKGEKPPPGSTNASHRHPKAQETKVRGKSQANQKKQKSPKQGLNRAKTAHKTEQIPQPPKQQEKGTKPRQESRETNPLKNPKPRPKEKQHKQPSPPDDKKRDGLSPTDQSKPFQEKPQADREPAKTDPSQGDFLKEMANRYLTKIQARQRLRQAVAKFRHQEHPLYSKKQKEMFLVRVLRSPDSQKSKAERIRREMP